MKQFHTTYHPRQIQRVGRWMGMLLVVGGLLTGCASLKPVSRVTCSGPSTLMPDEEGAFSTTINDDATLPIEVNWDFADGTTASGMSATHAFSQPGTYNVTVTATNRGSTNSAVCSVEVLEPPTCEITAIPSTLSMCTQPLTAVQFRPTVTGSTPISYQWNFGDGGSSTQSSPSHTYVRTDAEPATLTRMSSLTVSNSAGQSQCSAPVEIEPCPCDPNLVFAQACFERGESALGSGQVRRNLQDNLEVLQNNPRTVIAVLGISQLNERDALSIADRRAQAVAQFYIDNGIDASRISTVGTLAAERLKSGAVCTQTIPFCDASARDAYIESQQ